MVYIGKNGYAKLGSFGAHGDLHIEKEETVEIGDLKNINLNFASADIIVYTTDENTCKIVQKSDVTLKDNEKFSINQNSDTLEIKGKLHDWFIFSFGFLDNYSQIELYIPKTYANNLNIQDVSGNVSINSDLALSYLELKNVSGNILSSNKVSNSNYTLSTVSGGIRLDNLSGAGNISTVSGDIKINNFNMLDNSTYIKTISGDINLASISIGNQLNINTVSGDTNLNFIPDANCKINFSTVSGNVSSNLDIIYDGSNKKNKIINVGDKDTTNSINISTVSGDLKVN